MSDRPDRLRFARARSPHWDQYRALATDYDETLATGGAVSRAVVDRLWRLKTSGRRLILVTGRILDDLAQVFPDVSIFDRVVAENGAVLHRPDTGLTQPLAPAPHAGFGQLLRAHRVAPLEFGQVVVATTTAHQTLVASAIAELQLELRIILNRTSLMVLPSHVNKGTGLRIALEDLEIAPAAVVAVGDAENDDELLRTVGCGVAVGNAIPALKGLADAVTQSPHGLGVLELIDDMLAAD